MLRLLYIPSKYSKPRPALSLSSIRSFNGGEWVKRQDPRVNMHEGLANNPLYTSVLMQADETSRHTTPEYKLSHKIKIEMSAF